MCLFAIISTLLVGTAKTIFSCYIWNLYTMPLSCLIPSYHLILLIPYKNMLMPLKLNPDLSRSFLRKQLGTLSITPWPLRHDKRIFSTGLKPRAHVLGSEQRAFRSPMNWFPSFAFCTDQIKNHWLVKFEIFFFVDFRSRFDCHRHHWKTNGVTSLRRVTAFLDLTFLRSRVLSTRFYTDRAIIIKVNKSCRKVL